IYFSITGYVENTDVNLHSEKINTAIRTISTLGVDTNVKIINAEIEIAAIFLKKPRTQNIKEFFKISLIFISKVTAIV
ncbi:MAG: hypothetical protein UHD64_04885, partial [Bacteroidales bacterium]|nr:hypothetical protein [Bacteroidales bacterium]